MQCTLLFIAVHIFLGYYTQMVTVCQHFFARKFSFFPAFTPYFAIFEQVFDAVRCFSTAFSTNTLFPPAQICHQIAIYRAVVKRLVGAAIGRPPTNCNAICWFSAGKQSVIALRRCDFVKQNHTDEQCSPL
ncbi:MAG: hypothetical protein IJB91_05800, partial [Oscillospiraceae bacterium]|nr:hypothetical protein [Oscillospiraceae bacterium]